MPGAPFADLVFHVLAHVPSAPPTAASVFDPTYVRWVETRLGPSSLRALGNDRHVLASMLDRHDLLAAAQTLAFLLETPERLAELAARDVVDWRDEDVDDRRWLATFQSTGAAGELLRAACELESSSYAALPTWADPTAGWFDRARIIAPHLTHLRLRFARALRLRGRAASGVVWVGVPDSELALDVEHVIIQAAHEATVAELSAREGAPVEHDRIERAAIAVLQARAGAAGERAAFEAWRGRLLDGDDYLPARLDPRDATWLRANDLLR